MRSIGSFTYFVAKPIAIFSVACAFYDLSWLRSAFCAAAFALMGVVRLLLAVVPRLNEREPLIYMLNLLAMLLIVYAIMDKNGKAKPPRNDPGQPRRFKLSSDQGVRRAWHRLIDEILTASSSHPITILYRALYK